MVGSLHPDYLARGFTLLELLVGLVIIASLAAASVMFTSGYVTWSKQTADKQTLTILNDALTRYKTQGGNVNALTSGAAMSNVLNRLAQTLSWGGMTHQVLMGGASRYTARSLFAKGTGAQYRFTAYNNYTDESGGTSPAAGISLSGNLNFTSAYMIMDAYSSKNLNLNVSNSGTATLIVTSVSITGTGASAYHASNTSFSLAPGANANIVITMGPTAPVGGQFDATITVNSNAVSGSNSVSATGTTDTFDW